MLKIDKRYKKRKYFRVTENQKIQFSDNYDEALGFIGETDDADMEYKNEEINSLNNK